MTLSQENPWSKCKSNAYPAGMRFCEEDDRFWVSKDILGNSILFVHESEEIEPIDLQDIFSGLTLYHDSSVPGTRFVIKLDTKDIEMKFNYVCESIVKDAKEYQGVALFQFIYNELLGWSGFMRPKKTGLSHEVYTGLWGELSVVVDYFIKKFGAENLMYNWTGNDKTPQDLTARGFSLEVKATFKVTPLTIHISSLEQLDAPIEKQSIVHLRLTEDSDGRSLEQLIKDIEDLLKLNATELAKFRKIVGKMTEEASEKQMQQKNVILGLDCYEIKDNFPCLRRSETDINISKASYQILLQGIVPFRLKNGVEEFLDNVG